MTNLPSKEKLRRELILMAELYATTLVVIESPEAEISNSNMSLFQYCIKQRHKHVCSDVWPVNKWPATELECDDYIAFSRTFVEAVKAIDAHEILKLVYGLNAAEPILLDTLSTFQMLEFEKERMSFIEPTRNGICTEPKLTRDYLAAKEKLEVQRTSAYSLRANIARLLDEHNPELQGMSDKVTRMEREAKHCESNINHSLKDLSIEELERLKKEQSAALNQVNTEILYQSAREQHTSITGLLHQGTKQISIRELETSVLVQLSNAEDHICVNYGTDVTTLSRSDLYKLKQLVTMAQVGTVFIITFKCKGPDYSFSIKRDRKHTVTIDWY